MKPLFTQNEFKNSKSLVLLPLQCEYCGNIFYKERKEINKVYNNHPTVKCNFCSRKCKIENQKTKEKVNCKNCGQEFEKSAYQMLKCPNNFCSSSCAAIYNNKHKKTGNRRSKLEIWLEEQLVVLYPKLKIRFNKKDAINSELDIYIPYLKLAFELNGIFHYEPIFGKDKLSQIKNNDERKFQACLEKQIELVLIDTSSQKYFKENTSEKFLTIITKIINKKIELQ